MPTYRYTNQNNEVRMDFILFNRDQRAAEARVGGFAAYFTNNQLVRWDPVYGPNYQNQTAAISHTGSIFKSSKAVLTFYLLSQNQTNNITYPNTEDRVMSPSVTINAGSYIAIGKVSSDVYEIRLSLTTNDAKKLKEFTIANLGEEVALSADSQTILESRLFSPILDGVVDLKLSQDSYFRLLEILKKYGD
jgi:hypothetical protein